MSQLGSTSTFESVLKDWFFANAVFDTTYTPGTWGYRESALTTGTTGNTGNQFINPNLALKDSINTGFISALGEYKSSLNNYNILKTNLELANDVYNTIQLQYKSGIKTYLEVITAETDLRTTQANYNNALFQVLSSKLDVQRSLGTIQY